MASNKKKRKTEAEINKNSSSADYYRLNTKAIEDLAGANEENSPEVPEEELNKYRSKSKIKLPEWLKAVLIKMWFGGAVCFFILWGLGIYITDQLDMLFVLGLALGVVTDLLVNNLFRFYEATPGANDRWMMFPSKKFVNFFLNILYCFLILACIFTSYNVINLAIVSVFGLKDTVPVGVEPILFGVLYMAFDMLFIAIKHTFRKIVEDAKNSVAK